MIYFIVKFATKAFSVKFIFSVLINLCILVVNVTTILSNHLFSLLVCNFCNLNLSLPVLNAVLEFLALILLLNKLGWVWHICNLLLHCPLTSIVQVNLLNILLSLLDSFLCLFHLLLFDLHFNRDMSLFSFSISKLLLETV